LESPLRHERPENDFLSTGSKKSVFPLTKNNRNLTEKKSAPELHSTVETRKQPPDLLRKIDFVRPLLPCALFYGILTKTGESTT
jgi:hypothetical protein